MGYGRDVIAKSQGDKNRGDWEPLSAGPVATWTAPLCEKGKFVIQPFFYITGPKVPTGKYEHADPNKLGTDLMGATSGGGSFDHGDGILLTKKIKPIILHFDTIYSFPLERKLIRTQKIN